MSTVKVTAKDKAVVIASTNNPEYGYIRVESVESIFSNGWVREQKRSALVKGKVADLAKLNWKEGQSLPGKIVVIESTKEPYAGAQPKINPSTAEVMKFQGAAIYRDAIYTTDMSAQDILLKDAVTEPTSFASQA